MIRNNLIAFFIHVIPLFCLLLMTNAAYGYEFPPYEGLTLKVEGRVTENYSNNITYAQDDENRIEQWTTMLVFGIDMRYEGKKRALNLGGKIRHPIRFKDSDVQNSSELMTLNFQNEFSEHDRIRIRDIYTHTKVPVSFEEIDLREECVKRYKEYGLDVAREDPRCSDFEREFGVSQGDFDTYRNDFSFNYVRDISERFYIATRYANNRYDSSRENSNDSIRNTINLRINYRPRYTSTFFLFYAYSDTSYDEGDNISTDTVRTGIKQYMTKKLYFSGEIGMVFTPTKDSISVDALLTDELDEETIASIDFSRDIRAAVDREDVFRSWRVTGRFSRLLMEDLNLLISVFYGEGDFVSDDVTDTLLGSSVSLNYIFWQHKRGSRVDGNFGYAFSESDSTDENRGYNRSLVDATLSIAF